VRTNLLLLSSMLIFHKAKFKSVGFEGITPMGEPFLFVNLYRGLIQKVDLLSCRFK